MTFLLRNIRFYILLFSAVFAEATYYYVHALYGPGSSEIELTQRYGLISVTYLYIALYIGPVTRIFFGIPFRSQILKARRAIGVSACFFALMHARSGFFDELGGLVPFLQLNTTYHIAIALSTVALVILTLMALTSFDAVIRKMTFPKWKRLHQLVYLAGVFIVLHATLIGSHMKRFGPVSVLFYGAFIILIFLHGYIHLSQKIKK
ncbi:MAG: ferric reductase-like transmembrane domain-containing protein [Candidatus Levybacteria bacterium]|nr:ferric reductase-like transmembrane domain-containing protein [Candidatus Levybacteria bacterium]